MYIRYFARTDESETGRTAAAYCDDLVATGIPVRLVPTMVAELQVDEAGRSSSIWDRHRNLLVTPMVGDYVNVVCGDLVDWERFHTANVRNVLLLTVASLQPRDPQPDLLRAIARYDAVYAPSDELADAAERATGRRPTVGSPQWLQ